MNWRERLADAISGGRLTYWAKLYGEQVGLAHKAQKDAMIEAARRDEAIARAEVAEKQKRELALDMLAASGQAQDACEALRSILTARNITEARKIARQALGGAE